MWSEAAAGTTVGAECQNIKHDERGEEVEKEAKTGVLMKISVISVKGKNLPALPPYKPAGTHKISICAHLLHHGMSTQQFYVDSQNRLNGRLV